jgi:hypothetical protein
MNFDFTNVQKSENLQIFNFITLLCYDAHEYVRLGRQ